MTQIESSPLIIRPRFELESPHSVEAISKYFKHLIDQTSLPYNGKVRYGYITIFPNEEEHHFWSPHLSLIVEEHEEVEDTTTIRGHFGPSPSVWTFFIFIYTVLVLAIIIIAVIGFANLSIGYPGTILYALPILIIALAGMYVSSYLGQQKGKAQMRQIYHLFDEHLKSMNGS